MENNENEPVRELKSLLLQAAALGQSFQNGYMEHHGSIEEIIDCCFKDNIEHSGKVLSEEEKGDLAIDLCNVYDPDDIVKILSNYEIKEIKT